MNGADVKTIEVSEKKRNITLDDVVISPYQIIVHATTTGEQMELTDDRREKLLSRAPDLTDAEMYELLGLSYEPCHTIAVSVLMHVAAIAGAITAVVFTLPYCCL